MDFWGKALIFLGLKEPHEELVEPSYPSLEDSVVRKVPREGLRKPKLRPVSSTMQVHIIEPRHFNDAQFIANKFKSGVPVILNLQSADKDVAKRIIDFSSGLVYALDGAIATIAQRVFLITPKNVSLAPEEKQQLQEKFFNQL